MPSLRAFASLGLALLLALPAASAWTLAATLQPTSSPPAPTTGLPDPASAWSFALARPLGGTEQVVHQLGQAVACGLGDITGDGVGDLVVQVQDAAGNLRLQALAGPDLGRVVWTQATAATRILECAPDLDVDRVADPVVRTVGQATAAPGAGQAAQQVLQVVSGVSGQPLLGRQPVESAVSQAQGAAGAGLQAGSRTVADLLPAAAGAAAYVEQEVRQAQAAGLALLPAGSLTATAQATARMVVTDARGLVASTVEVATPGVQPLALAPLGLAGGLPGVAALTTQAIPLQEVAGHLPKLSVHNPDGTLAWAVQLPASAGVPLLLPRAGDLDLDGVGDLIVLTVEQGAAAAPGAAFHVLSGLDGHTLLDSGAPVAGVLAVVPLGALPAGPALLQAKRLKAEAELELSALDGQGTAKWRARVDAASVPINVALDAYTGDALGFTDLTGDLVPDVGLAVAQADRLLLRALDGATGAVAWSAEVPGAGASAVLPVLAQATGPALAAAGAGVPADLLVLGTPSGLASVTRLAGSTGLAQWTATATLAADQAVRLSARVAGDVDKDGVQDLLVTVARSVGSAPAVRGAPARLAGDAQGAQDAAEGSSVTLLSGSSGTPSWSNATGTAPLAFQAQPGPAAQQQGTAGTTQDAKGTPLPPLPLAVLALAALAGLRRRKA